MFSPHPASRRTTNETVRLMRPALAALGAPVDLLQCIERPSIPLAQALMASCDLTIATGGPPMVRSAYSSGKPALRRRRRQCHDGDRRDGGYRGSRTQHAHQQDQRPRVRAVRPTATWSLIRSIYDAFLAELQQEGGYLVNDREKEQLRSGLLGRRGPPHRGHDRAAGAGRRRARRDSRFRRTRRSSSCPKTRSARSICSRPRSSASCWPSSATPVSTWRSTSCGGFSKPAAAATRAASIRSMTITCTGWR